MAIVKQGGSNPYKGQVLTTMGYRASRGQLCMVCGERKEDGLFTRNQNGQDVCPDCASPKDGPVLRQQCDPDNCACGRVEADGGDPE